MRTLISTIGLLIALVISLAACDDSSTDTPEPTFTPESTAETLSPVLIDLQHDFEQISEAHTAILKVWEDLATNVQVQCGSYPPVISPESISAEEDPTYTELADLLRSAAIDTNHAIDLWQAECLNPRTVIPSDVIDEGRFAARSAGDALRAAQTELNAIQGK